MFVGQPVGGGGPIWFLSIVNRLGEVASGAHGIVVGWEALVYFYPAPVRDSGHDAGRTKLGRWPARPGSSQRRVRLAWAAA